MKSAPIVERRVIAGISAGRKEVEHMMHPKPEKEKIKAAEKVKPTKGKVKAWRRMGVTRLGKAIKVIRAKEKENGKTGKTKEDPKDAICVEILGTRQPNALTLGKERQIRRCKSEAYRQDIYHR